MRNLSSYYVIVKIVTINKLTPKWGPIYIKDLKINDTGINTYAICNYQIGNFYLGLVGHPEINDWIEHKWFWSIDVHEERLIVRDWYDNIESAQKKMEKYFFASIALPEGFIP